MLQQPPALAVVYIPAAFQIVDEPTLFDFVDRYSFATLVSQVEGRHVATHLPLLLDRGRRMLLGHVARGNPQWQCFDGSAEALAIFPGPHAYISPSWYVTTPAVPTWNYVAVHVYGAPRLMADAELATFVDVLVDRYESSQPQPWPNELPVQFRASLLRGIVGFELPIARIEGKFKLGQNRPAADQASMLARLEAGNAEEQALAAFSRERR